MSGLLLVLPHLIVYKLNIPGPGECLHSFMHPMDQIDWLLHAAWFEWWVVTSGLCASLAPWTNSERTLSPSSYMCKMQNCITRYFWRRMELPFLVTPEKRNGNNKVKRNFLKKCLKCLEIRIKNNVNKKGKSWFVWPLIQQGREKGKGQRTNKQDEDQTRPATHSPKLLRDKGHRGTKDTEGQRTLRDNGHWVTKDKSDTVNYT